jgi:hypothetical protein
MALASSLALSIVFIAESGWRKQPIGTRFVFAFLAHPNKKKAGTCYSKNTQILS